MNKSNKNHNKRINKSYKYNNNNYRPTFTLDDGSKVRSGGVLFIKYDDNVRDYKLLLFKKKNGKRYEDFGGKTSHVDKTYIDTICREVYEESNGIISIETTTNFIKDLKPVLLYRGGRGGYLLYIVKLQSDFTAFDNVDIFGNIELTGRERTIKWLYLKYIYNNGIKNILHLRLSSFKKFRSALHVCTHTNLEISNVNNIKSLDKTNSDNIDLPSTDNIDLPSTDIPSPNNNKSIEMDQLSKDLDQLSKKLDEMIMRSENCSL